MTAASEEELMAKVSEHVRKVHNVRSMTGTLARFVRSTAMQRSRTR